MIGPFLALSLATGSAAAVLPIEGLGAYSTPMRNVLEHPTLRQVVGPMETPLSLEVSAFLLDHPDLTAWIVRRHKLAPYVIEMRGPGRSWADDGDGTTGFIDLAFSGPGRRAYYTEGTHVSALFPDIRAAAVIVMDIHPSPKAGCGEHVVSSFDVYLRLRSTFLSAMVKALRPFIKSVLIRKFTRAFSVAQQVGILLAQEPDSVRREILSYPGLSAADRETARRLLDPLEPAAPLCL